MQVQNKHDKAYANCAISPACFLWLSPDNSEQLWQACDTHFFNVNDAQTGFLHNLNHMYIQGRTIRRVVRACLSRLGSG